MAYTIILDTSAAINLLNQGDKRILSVIENEQATETVITGITRFELGVGIKENADETIAKIPCISLDCEAYSNAAKMYRELAKKGKTPPLKDCFIAACAIRVGAVLITLDNDFEIFRDYGLDVRIIK